MYFCPLPPTPLLYILHHPPQQKHNYSNKCFSLNVQCSIYKEEKALLHWIHERTERVWWHGMMISKKIWWLWRRRWGWHDTVIAIALLFLLLPIFSCSSFFQDKSVFCELCHCSTYVTCVHTYIKMGLLMAYYKIGFLWGKYSIVSAVVVVPSSQSFFLSAQYNNSNHNDNLEFHLFR